MGEAFARGIPSVPLTGSGGAVSLKFCMPKSLPTACVAALSLLFSGCAHYSKVSEKKRASDVAVTAEQKALALSQERLKKQPRARIAAYLDAANAARIKLAANPNDTLLRSDYNFAVARVVEIIEAENFTPWDAPLVCDSPANTKWSLRLTAPDPRPEYHPSNFQILPTDRYDFKGKLVGERVTNQGLGAPVVVIGKDHDYTKIDTFAQGKQVYYGFTALIRFEGPDCELVLVDPLEEDDITLDRNRYPLAADFQAPLALALAELNVEKRELEALFKPGQFAGAARLARLQPYHPDKIPVVCIHGLGNSPATWAPVIEFLRGDAEIRDHYQFWFFSYPSGLPYPLSAAILRNQLNQIRQRYPNHQDIVVIGHSMGGMISRLLLTDSGMTLWDAYYDKPPGEIPFSEETRAVMTRTLIFDPQPHIARVVFVSASHRGSDLATNRLGRLGAKIVGNPIADDQINEEALSLARPEVRLNDRHHLPNSINLLDPGNRFLATIDALPLKPGVPFHSLMGDRGKGGNLDRTKPFSSDGIVPYWSSHLQGAQSERIIPSNHWSHLHPLGMAEIKRILLLHLGPRAASNPHAAR